MRAICFISVWNAYLYYDLFSLSVKKLILGTGHVGQASTRLVSFVWCAADTCSRHMEANCSMKWTLSAGGSFMQAGRSLRQKPYSVFLLFGFTFGLMWMSLAASVCYLPAARVNLEWQNTFVVVLTEINVIQTGSAQIATRRARKEERAIKADRWGAEKRFSHNPKDISIERYPVFLLFVPRCVLQQVVVQNQV